MSQVNPKLLIVLAVVVLFAIYLKISNPHRKFSTQEYWTDATLQSVAEVPDEALQPGNKNGGVLMWAAMAVKDPLIIEALVARGAEINEADTIFKGTPLTGAAGFSSNLAVIDKLIELGADINQLVNNAEDALMIAAQYNHHGPVVERLIHHGADTERKNSRGMSAEDLARKNNNQPAIKVFQAHSEKMAQGG
ncbi:MAG: ankyrin repeat domain-containing protein [Candidatus Thiodiazotropha taylori]|nr:ankyrin repeat domain-containing protein [Candidatus Thiodiazotropha taylori]MCW4234303.1 ankyrin repeat domain-containing protein [Candidatus Thiodiazotropha taylori]